MHDLPIAALTILGALITLLGVIVGGNYVWAIIGLAAITTAGILATIGRSSRGQ
jgi:hypothetical protein